MHDYWALKYLVVHKLMNTCSNVTTIFTKSEIKADLACAATCHSKGFKPKSVFMLTLWLNFIHFSLKMQSHLESTWSVYPLYDLFKIWKEILHHHIALAHFCRTNWMTGVLSCSALSVISNNQLFSYIFSLLPVQGRFLFYLHAVADNSVLIIWRSALQIILCTVFLLLVGWD